MKAAVLSERVISAAFTRRHVDLEEAWKAEEDEEQLHQNGRVLEHFRDEGDDLFQHRHAVEAHDAPEHADHEADR